MILIAQGNGYGAASLMLRFLQISRVGGYMLSGAAAQFAPLQIMKAQAFIRSLARKFRSGSPFRSRQARWAVSSLYVRYLKEALMGKRHSKRLWAALGLLYIGLSSAAADESEPVIAKLSFETDTIVSGLQNPWNIAFLSNGDILITERDGRLRWFFLQSGLFEAEPHPRFEHIGWLYLTFSVGTDRANTPALGRARCVDDGAPRLEEFEELVRADALRSTHEHYGARMAWMPDGTLRLTSCEGAAYRFEAQNLGSHFGNPFADRAGARPKIFSYGHRNPQGLAATADGRTLSNEPGPLGGDELNAITPGANYGWPIAINGRDYSCAEITPLIRYPGTEDPLVTWTPAIVFSSLLYYEGELYPRLSKRRLSTGLVGKQIRAVEPDRPGASLLVGPGHQVAGHRPRPRWLPLCYWRKAQMRSPSRPYPANGSAG